MPYLTRRPGKLKRFKDMQLRKIDVICSSLLGWADPQAFSCKLLRCCVAGMVDAAGLRACWIKDFLDNLTHMLIPTM